MKHFVVTDVGMRLYIVMSMPEEVTTPYAKFAEVCGNWYAVFVYDDYETAEKRCEEMNQIVKEKGEWKV